MQKSIFESELRLFFLLVHAAVFFLGQSLWKICSSSAQRFQVWGAHPPFAAGYSHGAVKI